MNVEQNKCSNMNNNNYNIPIVLGFRTEFEFGKIILNCTTDDQYSILI
jgi:hypothetical protein